MDGSLPLHEGLDMAELLQNHKKMEPIGSEIETHPMVLDFPYIGESVQFSNPREGIFALSVGKDQAVCLLAVFVISNPLCGVPLQNNIDIND